MTSPETIASDPAWMPHRLDISNGRIQFLYIPREKLASVTFLAHYPASDTTLQAWLPLAELAAMEPTVGALHFIFHTAFCRSTLLAKALDIPGIATGYSEPGILNDLAAAGHAGAPFLGPCLALLARPREVGETVFVKPSNHANVLIPAIMTNRPDAHAVLLSSSLTAFLNSIHRKGLMGRSWARQLYLEVQRYAPLDLGMSEGKVFIMSDLQVAGLAWLLNQRWRAMQISGTAGSRMRTLESDVFNARRSEVLRAVIALCGGTLDPDRADQVAAGPVFANHAKSGGDYSAQMAQQKADAQSAVVEEEIDKVGQWVGQIADQLGLSWPLPQRLIA